MHECGIRFFVQQPGEMEQRRLHLAVIESVTESGGTARSSADMVFEPGEALIVFFERDRAFMQQAIRIDAVMPDESAPPARTDDQPSPVLFSFEVLGLPISAETRQSYRLSTEGHDLPVTVGDEQACKMPDVSESGFSAICSVPHPIGTILEVVMSCDGKQYRGNAIVQSVKVLGEERFRHGFRTIQERNRDEANELDRALEDITSMLQRERLEQLRAG